MQNHASVASVSSVVVQPAASTASSGDFRDSRASQEAERAARYRLVIEEGPNAGSFIYKTMDRVTGEVVQQLPREEVVALMQSLDYSAGALIDARA